MANSENAAWQYEATSQYDNGDYDKAYKTYLKLSKKGDRFSTYRVSYMLLKGQGIKTNLIESFARAFVAAENGNGELKKYRDAVGALKMTVPIPGAEVTAPEEQVVMENIEALNE